MPDPEIELDRTYTVPLSRAWIAPRHRRTARAVNVLREFAERHMKSSEIKIESDLNERMWNRGITKPPRRIKVRMMKDEDGLVTISLPKTEEKEETVEESSRAPEEQKSGESESKGEGQDKAKTESEKKSPEVRSKKVKKTRKKDKSSDSGNK